ncbi:MAG: AtpZ/AtpI family protein [Alphaproteobacteria bacterium]|nr:AtpZ/AtpI family protein [Alphaproteobacteria bacterium]
MSAFKDQVHKTRKTLLKKAGAIKHPADRHISGGASVLGVYGWHMSIPVFLGVVLGRYLDKNFAVAHISWTLTLIIVGALISFYNANLWVQKATKPVRKGKDDACKP